MTRITPEFDQRIADWLEDDPDRAPGQVVGTVLAALPSIRQRRRGFALGGGRTLAMPTSVRLGLIAAALVLAASGLVYLGSGGVGPIATGSPSPTPSSKASPAISAKPSVVPRAIDTRGWTTYTSGRYDFTVGHPPDWTEVPANRDWTFETDAADWLSPAQDAFLAPGRTVRVSAWSVALDPGTSIETSADIEAWVQGYCQRSDNGPCTGIHDRAVPLCLERRDCHPALLVPFRDDVQAFFSGGIYDAGKMTVVAVWWGESAPAVAPYGGSQRLLEAFLATMSVYSPSTIQTGVH